MRTIHRVLGFILIALELCSVARAALTCDLSIVSRRRCGGSNNILESACLSLGCCYNRRVTLTNPLRCYRKRDISRGFISFGATRRTPTGPGNPIGPSYSRSDFLQFGGEPGFPGSLAILSCDRRRVGRFRFRCNPGINHDLYSCNRMGCCFFEGDPNGDPPIAPDCYRSSYFVYSLRTTCGPGLEAPPRCDDTDDCTPNPCANQGVCIDGLNKFECRCPGQISGTLCQDVCLVEPFIPTSGTIVGNTGAPYQLSHSVTYTCPAGTVGDLATLQNVCLITGQWSQPTGPSCRTVCGPPPNNPLLTTFDIMKSVYEVLDLITYTCLAGSIVINTPSTNMCLSNGEWLNRDPPQCTGCPDPPPTRPELTFNPPNGPYPITATIAYTCSLGNAVGGATGNTCNGPQGEWQFPLASILMCGCTMDPTPVPNSDFTAPVAPHVEGASVVYTCQTGRTLVPPGDGTTMITSTCTNGVWSLDGMMIDCLSECGIPPNNGLLAVNIIPPYQSGAAISYSCTSGQELGGVDANTCTDGSWATTDTTALLLCGCTGPPITPDLTVDLPGPYLPIVFVTYTCVVGDPVGLDPDLNTCQADGFWSIPLAADIQKCGCAASPPTRPGVLNVNGATAPYLFSETVMYTCVNNNPVTGGETTNTCTETGWMFQMAEIATCASECSRPTEGTGLMITPVGLTFMVGDAITYECLPTFILDPLTPDMFTCQPATFVFNFPGGVAPVCKKECTAPPGTVTNANPITLSTPYLEGLTWTYTCTMNYELVGTALNTCGADGLWSINTMLPECKRICPDPMALTSGTFADVLSPPAQYLEDTIITYMCDATHLFADPAQVATSTCQADGTWTLETLPAVFPTCVLINEDIDLVIIMDSTTLLDDCDALESRFMLEAPFSAALTPMIYNSAEMPNYFRQEFFVLELINTYIRFTGGRSRVSLVQHSSACVPPAIPNAYDLTQPVSGIPGFLAQRALLCGSYEPLSIVAGCAPTLLDRGDPTTNKKVILFISSDISTITSSLTGFINSFDTVRGVSNLLDNFLTMSVLPTGNANYPANESFLKNIACGNPMCNRFLGSIDSGAAAAIALMNMITFV